MQYHQRLLQLIMRTTIKLRPNEKLALLALANFTNEFGLAYPTLEQIGECTSLSKSSVIRALQACEKRGLIIKSKGHTGRATTYRFTCFMKYEYADELLGVFLTLQDEQVTNKEFDHIVSNELSAWGVSQTLIRNTFEEFWERYPKKIGKAHTYFAFVDATKLAEPIQILDGLSHFLETHGSSVDEKFIPHPVNWLVAERWLDEW